MWEQIQRIPTPFMWVSRDKRPPQTDGMGVLPGAVTAQAAELVNFDAAPQEDAIATFTGDASVFDAGAINMIVTANDQSDGLGALGGAMVPANAFMFIDGAGQSETIAALAGTITPDNEFMIVEPAAQSEALSTFAGTITPAASQP